MTRNGEILHKWWDFMTEFLHEFSLSKLSEFCLYLGIKKCLHSFRDIYTELWVDTKFPCEQAHFMHRLFILTPFSHFYAAFVSELPRLLHPNYSSQFNCQHFCCKKAPSEGKIWNNQLSVKMTILFYKCFIPWQIVSFYNPIWFENSATYQL